MANFTIPKNKDYTFTLKVMEKDSFLPQDLTNMSTANIEILLASTGCSVYVTAMTVLDALNGVLQCTMPLAQTDLLTIERGDKVDGYYLKPAHQATITVTFSDGTPTVFSILDKVYAAPTECLV